MAESARELPICGRLPDQHTLDLGCIAPVATGCAAATCASHRPLICNSQDGRRVVKVLTTAKTKTKGYQASEG
eukprot:981228-Amphidinium_carterae.1